jgi:prevent-host-death family protein
MAPRQSIADARKSLPALVRQAESGKAVELTRRGEPVAVLIGHRQFTRLTATRRGFSQAYQEFLENVDLKTLAVDPEEVFARVRDESRGRDVEL